MPWDTRASSPRSRTSSLVNGNLEARHVDLVVQPPVDLVLRGSFEEQLHAFLKVGSGFLNGLALTGDVQFRAERDEVLPLSLDECCQLVAHRRPLLRSVSACSGKERGPESCNSDPLGYW